MMMVVARSSLLSVLTLVTGEDAAAFYTSSRSHHMQSYVLASILRGQEEEKATTKPPASAQALEEWLVQGSAVWDTSLLGHATFDGGLRGLQWKGNQHSLEPGTCVASVPAATCLQQRQDSPLPWDVDLACQLWDEVCLGAESQYWGYLAFFGVNEDSTTQLPPFMAPDALRHWTDAQCERLRATDAGAKLLKQRNQQQEKWLEHYHNLPDEDNKMSLDQFCWAMEVVRSHSFQGSVTNQVLVLLLPVFVMPIVGGLVSAVYLSTDEAASPAVLAALAVGTAVSSFVASRTEPATAAMIPLIGSANHAEQADGSSKIRYNRWTDSFELLVGPDCVDEQQQLFISYGEKSDAELLLNYGFLPSIVCCSRASVDEQRCQLAEAFTRRNQ